MRSASHVPKDPPGKKYVLPVVEIDNGILFPRVLRVAAREINGDRPAGHIVDGAADIGRDDLRRRDRGGRPVIEDLTVLHKKLVQLRAEVEGAGESLIRHRDSRCCACCGSRGRGGGVRPCVRAIIENEFDLRAGSGGQVAAEKRFVRIAARTDRGPGSGRPIRRSCREIAPIDVRVAPKAVEEDGLVGLGRGHVRGHMHRLEGGERRCIRACTPIRRVEAPPDEAVVIVSPAGRAIVPRHALVGFQASFNALSGSFPPRKG